MSAVDLMLQGCRSTPLAHYLKALGILRIVSEQADAAARGFWRGETFVLRTSLVREDLEAFMLGSYAPTPIIAPWNGGSGFYPKDNRVAIETLEKSRLDRFRAYRDVIAAGREVADELEIGSKPDTTKKPQLLTALRGRLPASGLDWLDAAVLLSGAGPKYPPLLGTGGNDGRLDFSNNYMQRLLDVIDVNESATPTASLSSLRSALHGSLTTGLSKAAIGQFHPGSAGGANASSGFDGDAIVNPWDFVLMLEGAVLFAGASVRRLETEAEGALSYPFSVRPSSVGYGSSSFDDASSARAEMWFPLWSTPSSLIEIRALLSEGRVRVGRRRVRDGVDFARAVATLGVDRGIVAFERYGLHERNGLSYFAVPLQRVEVRREPKADLLQQLDRDSWLERFRRQASSKEAPARVQRALRRLESTILDLCLRGDALRVQDTLCALGDCEEAMGSSFLWTTEKSYLRPVPALTRDWLEAADDGSVELRLAASLASVRGVYGDEWLSLRQHLAPVRLRVTQHGDARLRASWREENSRDVVWPRRQLTDLLNAVMTRRLTRASQAQLDSFADWGLWTSLDDVRLFIEGRLDEARLLRLLWGCALVDWPSIDRGGVSFAGRNGETASPGAFFALLKLCFAQHERKRADGKKLTVPLEPRIHRLAAQGAGAAATQQAVQRLRGSGLVPAFSAFDLHGESAARAAAALMFPLSPCDLADLATMVLRPENGDRDGRSSHSHTSAFEGVSP